jgi:hypothetical protein
MEPTFLYQKWLGQALQNYVSSPGPPVLKGRTLGLSPRQYGAALLQAYLGQFSLAWLAEVAGVPLASLKSWRQELEFLLVMDWSKSLFAEDFREHLMRNDYSLAQVHEIAGEFSLLEESLRVRVRTHLYQVLKNLGEKLGTRQRHGVPLARHDFPLFRRLFMFFLALEYFWRSPAEKWIQDELAPLAREVVWPLLGLGHWLEPELTAIRARSSLAQIRELLEGRLRETFASLA